MTKEQRIRRLKSAGRPPKPDIHKIARSERIEQAAKNTETQRNERLLKYPWYAEYRDLCERFGWKQAAYIAWRASPKMERQPATEEEMAEVLEYKSSRTFRQWRANTPEIDRAIAEMQAAPLIQHRRDIYEALVKSALIVGKNGHYDRKLALEMLGELGEGDGGEAAVDWWEAAEDE